MLRRARRTTRAAAPRATWYAAFVLVALLASFLQLTQAPAPAQAATVATFPAPDLLNPRVVADATPAQADALRRFQDQAVDLTLAHYELSAGDREAVKSWGRTEAQAMLWGLMVKALETPDGERTSDQRQVRAWLSAITQRHVRLIARVAGEQMAQWMGRDVDQYLDLADSGTQAQLRQFFEPNAPSLTGPCDFTAPHPYEAEGPAYPSTDCGDTCEPGCGVPCERTTCAGQPTLAQFIRWASGVLYEQQVGKGFEQALTTLRAVVNISALHVAARRDPWPSPATASALGAGGSAVALHTAAIASSVTGGHLVGHVPELATIAPWSGVFSTTPSKILAATGTLVRTLVHDVNASLPTTPDAMAAMVFRSRKASVVPEVMLKVRDFQTVLLSLFTAATLPKPLTFAKCDNSLIPLALYGSPHLVWANTIDPSTGLRTQVRTTPCLNAVPAPAPSIDDPQFVVQRQRSHFFVQSPTISVRIDDDNPNTLEPKSTVRMTGNGWFVHQITNGKTPLEGDVRTLGMEYTDWQGRRNYVSLVHTSAGGYRFVGVTEIQRNAAPFPDLPGVNFADPLGNPTPATCRSTFSCWDSDSIDYLGPNGQPYTARVVDFQKPAGSPWHSLGAVTGSPVQFQANGFAPAYNNGFVTYWWRFQRDGCDGPCTLGLDPVYASPVSGPDATHTFAEAGTYRAELTAIDIAGQTVVANLTVAVGQAPSPTP